MSSTIAKMEDFMSKEDKKKLRKDKEYVTVEPLFLNKLVKAVGSIAETAKMLGYSPTGISLPLGANSVRKVIEIAAQKLYEDDYAPRATLRVRKTVVIQHYEDHLPLIKSMVKSTGGTYTLLEEST